nr:immunoglobulin light chain junction region [Macaca mulatta]
CQQYSSSPPTC